MLENKEDIEYEETKKDETTDNVRTLINAKPEHYGKIVVVKGFNDPEVVAYGDKMEEVIEKAEKEGYKVVSHKDDLSPRGTLYYCPCPCETFTTIPIMGYYIDQQCYEECKIKPKCPVCKYAKEIK